MSGEVVAEQMKEGTLKKQEEQVEVEGRTEFAEKRRNLEKIEKEFADLKEKFFSEKIEALKKEHELIKEGSHEVFLKQVKDLEGERELKEWQARKWKEYQQQNIQNIYESELKQAEDEYETEKKNLRERMMSATMEKKKKLLEEKNTMSLTDGNDRVQTRTLRKRGGNRDSKEPGSYKRRALNPPPIAYSLKDPEIMEDMTLIQKAISNHPTYGKHGQRPALDVYTDRGNLHYFNQTFEKNREVTIESKQESGKWQGTLVLISPSEIHIRSADGTKSRFLISQLRMGKYVITTGN